MFVSVAKNSQNKKYYPIFYRFLTKNNQKKPIKKPNNPKFHNQKRSAFGLQKNQNPQQTQKPLVNNKHNHKTTITKILHTLRNDTFISINML